MSVLVRERASGKVFVFAKGAESAILTRLSSESSSSAMRRKIDEEVIRFGQRGLRTLVFASKDKSLMPGIGVRFLEVRRYAMTAKDVLATRHENLVFSLWKKRQEEEEKQHVIEADLNRFCGMVQQWCGQ